METRQRRGGLVGPVLLIGAGILFLLSNLGLLGWGIWEVVFRLWPLLLIAVGLDLLLGHRSVLASALVLVVVLGIAGAAIWAFAPMTSAGPSPTTERISQSLEGAARADVEIASGIGVLRLGAMPEADGLIEGTVALGAGGELTREFQVRGDTAHLKLHSKGERVWLPSMRGEDWVWELKLAPGVPMRLKVNTGVGESTLDLAKLDVTNLEVNSGVGRTTLMLPAQGRLQARVHGGIGEVNVTVPAGMAARVRVEKGIGDVQVSESYSRQAELYVSPGYETAQNRLDLEVRGGIGRISVR